MDQIRQPGREGAPPGYRGRAFLPILISTIVLASIAALPVPASADGGGPGILVRFEPDAGRDLRSDALGAIDGEVARAFGLVPGLRLVELPRGVTAAAAIEEVSGLPGVEFATRDSVMEIDRAADDPLLDQLWGLTAIQAPSAWDVTTGSPDVQVAIIDTGIDLDHPDLAGNLWTNPDELPGNRVDDDGNGFVDDIHGWDFVNGDADPSDDQGHGTHTAGTVGAVGNNGTGVAGVAWDVSLVPLKICDSGGSCRTSDAIAALDYAVEEGIPISNNSYGYNGSCTIGFGSALGAAGAAGHLFVTSAGNEGRDIDVQPKYPASCPQDNVLTVAWLADQTSLDTKSNYGNGGVDLAAPGSQILSTTWNGTYGTKSGTSMAAPHVAGTAALLKSAEPTWAWPQLKGRILASTRKVCGLPVASQGVLDAGWTLSGAVDPLSNCPDVPIMVSKPESLTNSTSATFSFTGDPGANFECRLDLEAWQTCESPVTLAGLGNGGHKFSVNQTIGDGRTSAAVSWSWTVDVNPPSPPTASAAPTSPTTLRSATFTFSGEPGATFLCGLDDGPLAACTSPLSLSGLAEGQRSVTIFQTDRAGNRSQGTTRSWTIVGPPPEPPSITSAPAGLTSSRSASVTFSTAAGTMARCRLDRNGAAGPWTACSSPLGLTGLEDGAYRLAVVLRNSSGAESTPAETSWTVDGTAPAPPRIESGPSTFTGASVEVSFSGEPGASFECRLDTPGSQGTPVPCSPPFQRTGLAEGRHELVIRQRDVAGNLSVGSTVVWTADTTPPAPPSIEAGPTGATNSGTAEFTFAGEGGATAECRLEQESEASDWTACPAGNRWVGLRDGQKTLRVRLRDGAGNLSPDVVRSWTVDTEVPPAPGLSGGPDPVTDSRVASISISTEPGAIAHCRLDDGASTPCQGSFVAEGLPDGPHLLKVRQTDRAGNDSPEASWLWVVDTVAPAAPSIIEGPSGLTRLAVARFSLVGEEGARLECRAGDGAWEDCPEPVQFGPLLDGSSSASFRQVDRAGNVSPTVERSWVVDATAPEVRTARRSINRRGRAVLSIRATDGGGVAWLEVSFSSLKPSKRSDRRLDWTGGREVTLVSPMVPFWVRVVDRAENRSDWIRLKSR